MSTWQLYLTFFFIAGFVAGEIRFKGWWRNKMFYQIYTRSFMDSNDDGIGDLRGIINKLGHLTISKIKTIMLSPINTSPMVDYGYDISNFYEIDRSYGTMADFEDLLNRLNNLRMKIILDFVPNHTSDQHEWFINSVNALGKYKDYYVWREGRENNSKPPNNWLSVYGGSAWTYNTKRKLWYFHQFDYRQPDLNFCNPKVWDEMEEILKFWMNKGVHGFRINTLSYIYEDNNLYDEPPSDDPEAREDEYKSLSHVYTFDDPRAYNLLLRWRNVIDEWANSHNAYEKILVIESHSTLPNTMKYYEYGAHIPLNFNLFMHLNNTSNPSDFKRVINDWMENMPEGETANWVTSSHNFGRLATKFSEYPALLLSLAVILPGTVCFYYGDEIAMQDNREITWRETQDPEARRSNPHQYQKVTRDPFRTPFQWDNTINAGFSTEPRTWLPVNPNYHDLNLAKQVREQESHYRLYHTLTRLKGTSETLEKGSLSVHVLGGDLIFIVTRKVLWETIVLVVNFSNILQTIDLRPYIPGAENAVVVVSSPGSGIQWGHLVIVSKVEVPPNSFLVLLGKRRRQN